MPPLSAIIFAAIIFIIIIVKNLWRDRLMDDIDARY